VDNFSRDSAGIFTTIRRLLAPEVYVLASQERAYVAGKFNYLAPLPVPLLSRHPS
jgi:hypothetical protein